MKNIIYQVDSRHERVSDNWTGEFKEPGWLVITDKNGKDVGLRVGDIILFSDYDLEDGSRYYLIEQAECGIYRIVVHNLESN